MVMKLEPRAAFETANADHIAEVEASLTINLLEQGVISDLPSASKPEVSASGSLNVYQLAVIALMAVLNNA